MKIIEESGFKGKGGESVDPNHSYPVYSHLSPEANHFFQGGGGGAVHSVPPPKNL